jgi:hypothetical protein
LAAQFVSQLNEVVDLTVVRKRITGPRIDHGLLAMLQIDDREPTVGETDPLGRMGPCSLAIWATVSLKAVHRAQRRVKDAQ